MVAGDYLIKALFFDLDGTLLNSEKKVSPKTRQTLEKCVENGYKLFIATARPPLLKRMLGWDDGFMSLFTGGSYYNGGCVEINGYKEYIFIDDRVVKEILDCIANYKNLNISLQLEQEKHAFKIPIDEKYYKSWGIYIDETLNLNQIDNLKCVKILLFYSNLIDSTTFIDDELIFTINKICADRVPFYFTDKRKCIQVMGKSVNKLNSIEKIREKFNFTKDEIAVFGDDVNDMEMLSEYPFSFAMGNGSDKVKKAARFVTLDNDNDGIHEAICNLLKLI